MANTAPTNPFFYGAASVDPPRFVGRTQDPFHHPADVRRADDERGRGGAAAHREELAALPPLPDLPRRVQASQWFLVSYVSLQDARVRNLAGFLQTVGNALATARRWHPKGSLLPAWPTPCRDLPTFRQGLQTMAEAGLRCVLCLDEFEALLDAPTEFDDHFFDALRAAMDDQVLMLIIASARPLSFYGSRVRSVSRFFNLGNTRYLEELSEDEASALVRLPSTAVASQPALGGMTRRWPASLAVATHFSCRWPRTPFSRRR
ncbi:hypothetical protein [Candidatus Amarolinea dominans]|uniref:hypothetical protein n=1 Tax=Candidatus Amarolinea dominans TaxID=3140696 RepID=UPI001DD10ED7|nr:hypothetical protein [Anaerolineae bacterium]